jgi:hypothetical protein
MTAARRIQHSAMLTMLVLLLGGCGESRQRMTFGAKPMGSSAPADYKAELLYFMRTFLADPTNVRDAYISELAPMALGTEHYFVCVRYNPRIDGKYVGTASKMAIYFGGRVNQFIDAPPDQCGNAAYQPFPELEQLKPLGK